ncbi:hemerythrin [Maridesulfovibrio ferrireducens]|uniref:Hemerythrin n=1 Tax=Maridesulfovibrio ferrireducens TaxID=246191 RepID=A0A1G9E8T0_9BACT|nr:bacteriohemerythrin [Maridesulfovibrio ferrireducens]SDK72553.1 hemerythrin [Maridesulfovibrio ferrireducens]
MALLSWNDNYSIGIKKIDNEHKVLIGMINKAYDSIEKMEEQKVLLELISEMRQYAMDHFSTEEMFMKHYTYPETENHRKQHNHFMIYVASADNMMDADNNALDPYKVFKYLADWLKNHILVTDKQFGSFLMDKGVR